MGTKLVDFLLSIKDFLVGSVKGVANGPYSWASWVWPLALGAGIIGGLATGSAALAVGLIGGVPLAAAAIGAGVGLLTGGVGEVIHNQAERTQNRAADAKAPVQTLAPPQKHASLSTPTTEITSPSTPIRLTEAGQGISRG